MGPGILSWRSFCGDPCSQSSQACRSCSLGSHGSVGPAARLTCMVAAKAPPETCSSSTRGARGAEGCLPPRQKDKDEGLCWQFRGHLAHNCTRCRQTGSREDMLTHEPEVGAAKPRGVLPMDSTKEMNFMQHGLSKPALTRNSTFKREKHV